MSAEIQNPPALCKAAHTFRKTEAYAYLKQKIKLTQLRTPHLIRHFLGRLGSWHRASARLVKLALTYPELLKDLVLEIVSPPLSACPPPGDASVTLRSLVEKLDFDKDTDHVLQRLQTVYEKCLEAKPKPRVPREDDVEIQDLGEAFVHALNDSNMKPMVHAEPLMADYIFRSNWTYVGDDHYIGCSKPSCVSCHLYLRSHPDKVSTQSCHGNLWPKWCPPDFGMRRDKVHVENLILKVIRELKDMAWVRLVTQSFTTMRLLESRTGITTSGPGIEERLASIML